MSEVMSMPINKHAEWSVIAQMLQRPERIGEVIGIPVEQQDFSDADTRLLYATTVERYYGGQSVDPLIVGELVRDELSQYWGLPDNMAVAPQLVERIRSADIGGDLLEHANLVKRLSRARQLQTVCFNAIQAINEGKLTPEEIGDQLSGEALQVTAGSIARTEVLDWMDTGRQYVQQLKRVIAAKQQGIEIGVYTGYPFVDDFTTGIGPGELCFLAGDPGIGKTALAWACALGFVQRQMVRAPEKRVGTLMLSMEMNLYASTMRVVSALTGINGTRLREGDITQQEFQHILREWKNREGQPIYFNFASNFRLSQMRALIAEAIRRANVGFVVIDHFRMMDTDRRFTNPNQEDEAKVRFLKENIAKDLNVAVMCLAHTVKVGRGSGGESPRPRLSDLRGSGQIAAHADFVGFLWNPAKYMSEEARFEMDMDEHDMELLWEKNRFGSPDAAQLRFEPQQMRVLPR
jgi:replicative DNA helicase